ncbi:hypothetical protein BDY19DRAFT_909378 [Irpex rosettiformis]|uniref:Uncharacterized protein n=1 Tax=Irpex rosettiformis TaxID=378272 RepID=A0ACB8TT43_9APHY|nr:hypothetical protein BDY19DRAFT_909378 [Irpex rosettiformis]
MTSLRSHCDSLAGTDDEITTGCVNEHTELAKALEDPEFIEYVRSLDTVAMLQSALELKRGTVIIQRTPYDPFVEAMRRRARAQLEHEQQSNRLSRDSTQAKARRVTDGIGQTSSSATLYAISRLDEEHRKNLSSGSKTEQNIESVVWTKIMDMDACCALETEVRLHAEALLLDFSQRRQVTDAMLEDLRRISQEMPGESSSSVGEDCGATGGMSEN